MKLPDRGIDRVGRKIITMVGPCHRNVYNKDIKKGSRVKF
jgi:hypothetical protein